MSTEAAEPNIADNVDSNIMLSATIHACDQEVEGSNSQQSNADSGVPCGADQDRRVSAGPPTSQHYVPAPKAPHQDDLLVALKMLLFEACRFHKMVMYRRDVMAVVKQLDHLWVALEGSQEQKYEFLRARIQALFLWDRTTNGLRRDLLCPPQEMLEVFHRQRANRLRALPDGSLFFPTVIGGAAGNSGSGISTTGNAHQDTNLHSEGLNDTPVPVPTH